MGGNSMPQLQRAQLVQLHFGKPEHDVVEAEILEKFYSEEELAHSPELRARYESAKEDRAVAELVKLLYVLPAFAAAAKCTPITDQITRAIDAGELSESFTTAEYIVWARRNGIGVPKEIKRAFEGLNQLREWGARCDLLIRERDASRRECDELRAKLETKKREDEINPKSLTTLLRIIYGLAFLKFGHDHRRNKSAAQQISDALRTKGIQIHRDTIFDWLQAAIEKLPEDWDEHNPL
jgi:hypothetical protein